MNAREPIPVGDNSCGLATGHWRGENTLATADGSDQKRE